MKRSLTCVGSQRRRRRSSLTSLTRRPSPGRRLGSGMNGIPISLFNLFHCHNLYRGNIGFKWDVPSSIWFVQMLGEEAYLEQRRGFSNIALLQYNCYSSGLLLFSRIHTGLLRFGDRCGHIWLTSIFGVKRYKFLTLSPDAAVSSRSRRTGEPLESPLQLPGQARTSCLEWDIEIG